MRPKKIGDEGMNDLAISQARSQHQGIVQRLMTGPGDSEGAMRRAESRFGLGYWSQWNLRYKRKASAGFMAKISQAHFDLIEKSVRRDIQQLENLGAASNAANTETDLSSLVAEAEALLARIKAARDDAGRK